MVYLNSRKLIFLLLLKDHINVIIRGKWQEGKMHTEGGEGEGRTFAPAKVYRGK